MTSLTERLAAYVDGIEFKCISEDAIRKSKQVLLDTIGCTLGGFYSRSATIVRSVLPQLGGPEEARILGSGEKASCLNAILANGAALRFLDFMDYLPVAVGRTLQPIHACETIPATLALTEREQLSGKELILGIYLGYELSGKFCSSVGNTSLSNRGWHHATLGYYIMPLVAGKLLGLGEEQMCDALGISGCQATLGIVDAEGEEYSMIKNLVFPQAAYSGVLAAMMAKKGFTSPRRILEGKKGFLSSVLKDEGSLERLFEERDNPWIMENRLKPYPVCGAALGVVDAVLNIARKRRFSSDEVEKVTVRASKRTVDHVGDPAKRYPRNKETADHSAPFLVALALLEGKVEPSQFSDEKYSDPRILNVISRVEMEYSEDLDMPELYPAAEVEIRTFDGSTSLQRALYHRGHPKNPMSDREIEEKFLSMASKLMSDDRARELSRIVDRLEKLNRVSELTELM